MKDVGHDEEAMMDTTSGTRDHGAANARALFREFLGDLPDDPEERGRIARVGRALFADNRRWWQKTRWIAAKTLGRAGLEIKWVPSELIFGLSFDLGRVSVHLLTIEIEATWTAG